MVYMLEQAQYVEGVLQGVVGVNPSCIGASACLHDQTGMNPNCAKMKELGQDSAASVRARAPPDWQFAVVNGREPAQDLKKYIKSG